MQKQVKKVAAYFLLCLAALTLVLLFPKQTEPSALPPVDEPPLPVIEQVSTTTIATPIKKKVVSHTPSAKWSVEVETQVEQSLSVHFSPEDARVALAVLKHESHLNTQAVGYNCFYDQSGNVHETRSTSTKSRSCDKEDRPLAWSLDCGLVQRNFVGVDQCPAYAFDIEWSINEMAKLHADRGFSPWVSYKNGSYIPYLK